MNNDTLIGFVCLSVAILSLLVVWVYYNDDCPKCKSKICKPCKQCPNCRCPKIPVLKGTCTCKGDFGEPEKEPETEEPETEEPETEEPETDCEGLNIIQCRNSDVCEYSLLKQKCQHKCNGKGAIMCNRSDECSYKLLPQRECVLK